MFAPCLLASQVIATTSVDHGPARRTGPSGRRRGIPARLSDRRRSARTAATSAPAAAATGGDRPGPVRRRPPPRRARSGGRAPAERPRQPDRVAQAEPVRADRRGSNGAARSRTSRCSRPGTAGSARTASTTSASDAPDHASISLAGSPSLTSSCTPSAAWPRSRASTSGPIPSSRRNSLPTPMTTTRRRSPPARPGTPAGSSRSPPGPRSALGHPGLRRHPRSIRRCRKCVAHEMHGS